jgi:hypothetical protein
MDLVNATRRAQEATGDRKLGTRASKGRVQLVTFRELDGDPFGELVVLTDWISIADAVATMNAVAEKAR